MWTKTLTLMQRMWGLCLEQKPKKEKRKKHPPTPRDLFKQGWYCTEWKANRPLCWWVLSLGGCVALGLICRVRVRSPLTLGHRNSPYRLYTRYTRKTRSRTDNSVNASAFVCVFVCLFVYSCWWDRGWWLSVKCQAVCLSCLFLCLF